MKSYFRKSENLKAAVIFLIISFIFLFPAFLKKGTFVGGDWSVPFTKTQTEVSLREDFSAWKETTLVGSYFPSSNFQYSLFSFIFFSLGIQKGLFAKLFLLLVFFIGSFGVFKLSRHIGVSFTGAILSGFFYLTSPFIFNFTVIGWDYILLSLSILPYFILFFDLAVREGKIYFLFVAAVIFWIALLQSTSIIWFSLVVFSLLFTYLNHKVFVKRYIFNALILYLITFLLNFYWIVNVFLYRTPVITGSDNVLRGASLGTWQQVNLINLIRGWGSLYNYSYEYSYLHILKFIPILFFIFFIFTFLKITTLKTINKFSLFILFLFPFFLLLIGPYKIALLPFGNVLRDGGRHIALISFSFSILLGMGFDYLKKHYKLTYSYILILLTVLNAHPFFLGSLYKKPSGLTDIRLRTYEYPSDFAKIEEFLYKSKELGKVLYVPITDVYYDFSTKEFNGGYWGFTSIFNTSSPREGSVQLVDKEDEGINLFYFTLADRVLYDFENSFQTILNKMDIKYFVFYFDNMAAKDWALYKRISNSSDFENITNNIIDGGSEKSAVFSLKKPSQEIRLSNNFIYVNKYNIYYYDSLFSFLKNYDLIFDPDVLNKPDNASRLYFPEQFFSLDKNNTQNLNNTVPRVNIVPSKMLSYKLLMQKEQIKENNASSLDEKINILLSHNLNRLSEINTFSVQSLPTSFEAYVDNYLKIKAAFMSIPVNERDAKYFLTLQQFYSDIATADKFFRSIKPFLYKNIDYGSEDGNSLLLDFNKWSQDNFYTCEGTCYFFAQTNNNTLNLVFSDTENSKLVKLQDGRLVYDLKPKMNNIFNNDLIIKTENFNQDRLEKSENSTLKNDLFSIAEQIKNPKITKLFMEFNSLRVVDLENTSPGHTYQIDFSYRNNIQNFGIALIETTGSIDSNYKEGGKEKNVKYSKHPAFIFIPEVDKNKPSDEIISITKKIKSDNASTGFELFLFNYSPSSIYDFSISSVTVPSVYYENVNKINEEKHTDPIFKKLSPTKYLVSIDTLKSTSLLILNQQYSDYWIISDLHNKDLHFMHYKVNGYANGWVIDPGLLAAGTASFYIYFKPQTNLIIGYIICFSILIPFIVVTIIRLIRKRRLL